MLVIQDCKAAMTTAGRRLAVSRAVESGSRAPTPEAPDAAGYFLRSPVPSSSPIPSPSHNVASNPGESARSSADLV